MKYQTFRDVWMEVGDFIRDNRKIYGHPVVEIYSDYIDLQFIYNGTLRDWPEGGNERRIFEKDGSLCLCYTWSFDPSK